MHRCMLIPNTGKRGTLSCKVRLLHNNCDFDLLCLILGLDIIKDDDGVQGLYWCVNFPWPMSHRDVSLYNKSITHDNAMGIILWEFITIPAELHNYIHRLGGLGTVNTLSLLY